jgi:hypothetical protein
VHDAGAVARGDALEHLQHPPLELRERYAAPIPAAAGVAHDGGEVEREPVKDEDVAVAVAAGEVVEERDDVRGRYGEEGFGLAAGADGVVDLLESDGGAVGAAAAAVDVGVGAGAGAVEDLVAGVDVSAAVDAPAPAADRHGDCGRAGPWRNEWSWRASLFGLAHAVGRPEQSSPPGGFPTQTTKTEYSIFQKYRLMRQPNLSC